MEIIKTMNSINMLDEPLKSFAEKVYNAGIRDEYDRITDIISNSKGAKRLQDEDVGYDTVKQRKLDLFVNLTAEDIRRIYKFK